MADSTRDAAMKVVAYLQEESPSQEQLVDFVEYALRAARADAYLDASEMILRTGNKNATELMEKACQDFLCLKGRTL